MERCTGVWAGQRVSGRKTRWEELSRGPAREGLLRTSPGGARRRGGLGSPISSREALGGQGVEPQLAWGRSYPRFLLPRLAPALLPVTLATTLSGGSSSKDLRRQGVLGSQTTPDP